MKVYEDLGPDRGDEFQTDDEENQAERVCGDDDDDSDTDCTDVLSQNHSTNCMDTPWPQSYRQSMDIFTSMTPPPLTFLRTSSSGISTSLSPAYKRHRTSEVDFSLTKPLIDPRLSVRSPISSYQNLSSSELPLRQQQSSFAQAVLNGINVLCGIGLYTTPYAVREGGWLSLLILLFFGIISCYTGILLKRCLESFPGLQTYPDIGQAAFGLTGRLLLSILLYIELYAASVELVIMMSDNLSTLFPNAYLNLAGILYLDSHQLFAITATLIALPTVWLRDLSLLSYLSVGGVVSSMLVMLCLLWVGVMDEVGFHPGGTALNLADLSVAIGIYSYAYSGHSVLPNLYSSMKEPSRFPMVLIASFIFCFFMYAGVAIGGFLMFGDSIESQFTLNMPKELVASKIAVWTAVVNPLTKYALTITPVALSLEELIPSSRYRSHVVSIFIRTILVISTVIVALTVPFFGLMMALIGSSVAMLVALIFPPACYISIFKGKLTKMQIAACIFIMIVGFVNACVGTYSALRRIAGAID